MANTELIAGVDSYVLYGVESTFGTAVAVTAMLGGLVTRASFDVDRQISEHAGFAGTGITDGRVTAKYTTGTVNIRGSVEFVAQNFNWLEYLFGGTKTGAGTVASPFVYSLGKTTRSLTLAENLNNVTTDSERTFAGMIIDSATISSSVGEPVNVSLEFIGGKVAKETTISSAVAQSTMEVYNFSGGSIEMPDATVIGNVIDSVEISFSNNSIILYGLGQEQAVNGRYGKLNLNIKFTLKYLDDDQMDRLIGSSTAIASQTPVTLALKFTRGGNQYVDFVFTDVIISRISSSHNLNEFVVEDADLIARTLVVTEAQTTS